MKVRENMLDQSVSISYTLQDELVLLKRQNADLQKLVRSLQQEVALPFPSFPSWLCSCFFVLSSPYGTKRAVGKREIAIGGKHSKERCTRGRVAIAWWIGR